MNQMITEVGNLNLKNAEDVVKAEEIILPRLDNEHAVAQESYFALRNEGDDEGAALERKKMQYLSGLRKTLRSQLESCK